MSGTLLALLFACTPTDEDVGGTVDVRVDHPGKGEIESESPRTCVNEDGVVHVVWQDERDKVSRIYYNKSADGGLSFLTADVKLSTGEGDAANATIACVGERVYVAWEDKRDGELGYENIYVQWSDDGGRNWAKEELAVDNDPEGDFVSKGPHLFAAGDNAWLVWYDQVNGAYDIFQQRTSNGGEDWLSEPVRVDSDEAGSAYSANPRVVGDKDDHVVVVWEDRRGGNTDIYAAASEDNGKTFSEDRRLDGGDESGAFDSFYPRVAMAGEHVYVVWQDERYGENFDVLMNYSHSNGAGWRDEALRVESDAEGIADSRNPAVHADGERVWVAFEDNRSGGGYDIFLRWSEDAGDNWAGEGESRMETDDNGQAQSINPIIAVNGDYWLVAWQDFRDDLEGVGFNDLYYNYTVDGGATFQNKDIRVNSNQPGTSYAIEPGFASFGERVVTVWADGRSGTSDIFAAGREIGEQSVYLAPVEE